MPKKYGIVEKDLVVAHLVDLILTGKLRPGDRINRGELAKNLGVSLVPVQEAMGQLEHDGIITTRYHRGAYIERFDEATVREHYEIYGLLNAMAAERAATACDHRVLDRLEALLESLRTSTDPESFQHTAREYRAVIAGEYAGPRLSALIGASRCFLPRPWWASCQRIQETLLPFYEDETAALRDHDPVAAHTVNVTRSAVIADIVIAELTRDGVLAAALCPPAAPATVHGDPPRLFFCDGKESA